MNNKFDELTKSLAQSVTRRTALKKFAVGLAGLALACFGLPNKARATTIQGNCMFTNFSRKPILTGYCTGVDASGSCFTAPSDQCPFGGHVGNTKLGPCGPVSVKGCSFTV